MQDNIGINFPFNDKLMYTFRIDRITFNNCIKICVKLEKKIEIEKMNNDVTKSKHFSSAPLRRH